MKKLGTALMAITMALSAMAIPGLASAQQNGPIPYIQDRDRIQREDRRTETRHDNSHDTERRHHSYRDEPRRHHHRDRQDRDDDIAIGILGLATGAIIGGVIADEHRYPPPPRYSPPLREYRYSFIRPWTPEWYHWCSSRYRSFNPRTGTFIGYDGVRNFCNPNR